MSLDVVLYTEVDLGNEKPERFIIYEANITHNLNKMAIAVEIYKYLWRPEELGITHAGQLIAALEEGLRKLEDNPDEYSKYNASNGWGLYDHFVPFVRNYLEACKRYPKALVMVDR